MTRRSVNGQEIRPQADQDLSTRNRLPAGSKGEPESKPPVATPPRRHRNPWWQFWSTWPA